MRSIHFFTLIMATALFFQCKDDKRLKAKIDCIFSDDTTNVVVKGEFELQEE